jgi:predicted O-methyltransferase YrrM
LTPVKSFLRDLVKKVPIIGKPYVQRDELRAVVNQLWEPPGHFYSPLPAIAEIKRDAAKVFDSSRREVGGIDLNERGQLALFQQLTQYYRDQPFAERRQDGLRYRLDNPAFAYCDAIIFYCLLRHVKPQRVIEVGSGYSSCVLLDTNERSFGNRVSCTFIEPYPQMLYSLINDDDRRRVTVLERNVQDVDPSVFTALAPGDILFIDSSHVSKTNSDVNYLFFEILPRISSGVWVHVHDIFYPFEYPKEWVYQGRAWNEAYLTRAFLQYNDAFEIQLYNSFLERFHNDDLVREMPLCARYTAANMVQTSAQSLWLRKR